MKTKPCPLCGVVALVAKRGEFRFIPPPNVPGGEIVVLNAEWSECESCHERIIPHELDQALDREQDRRRGMLISDSHHNREKVRAPDSVRTLKGTTP